VLQAAPAVAWLKPALHVQAPVPVIVSLHTPPTPHAHGWQVGPKKPAAHWLHTLPTATKPAGHVAAHVLASVVSTWPGGQETQLAAELVHVAQLLLHAKHWVPLWNVPGGHVATQLVPLSRGVADPALQPVQPVAPVQVPQVAWHGAHATPLEKKPLTQLLPQAVPPGCTSRPGVHCWQLLALVQVAQPPRQGEHTAPLRK
jgi:hypothetical protein